MTFNTGKPVPSTDPRDLYDNAENLDKLVNGADPFYADRLGKLRESWSGMENSFNNAQEGRETAFTLSQADKESRFQAFLVSSGYVSKGDYAAGVVLEERNEYVAVDAATTGTFPGLYRPNASASLPLTLTGTWATDETSLVLLGDDVLRQELAEAEGARLIGTSDGLTVQDNLDSINLRLSDVANAKACGAIADGTSHPLSERFATLAEAQAVYPHATALTDQIDWAALQGAMNAGTARVHAPAGHYVLNKTVTRSSSIVLAGDGDQTIFDFSSGAGQLLITGSLTPMAQLSVSPSRHMRTLTWAEAHNLSARDVLILWNPTDYSWFGRRAEYRDGAILRVHSITDTTNVNLYDPCPDAYVASAMNVYKMNYISAAVKDITCIASAASELAPLILRHCVDSHVSGYSYSGGIYAGLQIDRCYNVQVSASSPINASPFVNNEYGTVISNSTHVTVSGQGMYATRHAVSIGGTALEATPPNRYVRISNMSVLGASAGTNAADAHGNSDYIVYDNCFILGGGGVAGRNPTVRNCTVLGETGGAFADRKGLYTAECNGGTVTIENTVIDTTGDGNTNGFVHFTLLGPGENDPLGTGLNSNFNLIVRNCTIIAPNAHANAKAVRVLSRNSNKSVNVTLDGLTVVSPNLLSFLYLDETVLATVPGEFLIVDNVYGPAGATLIHPTAGIANRATREMRQVGFEDVAVTTASNSAIGAGATFRYKYSRIPTGVVSVASVNGVAKQAWGGDIVASFVYSTTANSIRGGIRAVDGAVFASEDTARINYAVSVQGV